MSPRKRPVTVESIPKRFTVEYLESRSKETKSKCREWTNSVNKQGYAQVGEWPYNAHVIAYVLSKESLDETEIVRHLCHNRKCINPDHLSKGSHLDNWLDSEEKHRDSCKQRRGKPASNRIPILVDGQRFNSKSEAMSKLRRGSKYIKKHGIPIVE